MDKLRHCRGKGRFLLLLAAGITGNGHMMMLERDSDEIIDLIVDWLDEAVFAR